MLSCQRDAPLYDLRMTGRTRTSQVFYDISDRVFRVGEQLVVLSVTALAWRKTHSLILQVFSIYLLLALISSIISWCISYFERNWIRYLVGGLVGSILIILIMFFREKTLDALMLALFQGQG